MDRIKSKSTFFFFSFFDNPLHSDVHHHMKNRRRKDLTLHALHHNIKKGTFWTRVENTSFPILFSCVELRVKFTSKFLFLCFQFNFLFGIANSINVPIYQLKRTKVLNYELCLKAKLSYTKKVMLYEIFSCFGPLFFFFKMHKILILNKPKIHKYCAFFFFLATLYWSYIYLDFHLLKNINKLFFFFCKTKEPE